MTEAMTWGRYRRFLRLVLVAAWAVAFAATHIPAKLMSHHMPPERLLHLVGYAGLGGLFWVTLYAYGCTRRCRVWIILTVLMLYGALDEITQPFFNRCASIVDWSFDCIGVAIALIVCELVAAMSSSNRTAE